MWLIQTKIAVTQIGLLGNNTLLFQKRYDGGQWGRNGVTEGAIAPLQ